VPRLRAAAQPNSLALILTQLAAAGAALGQPGDEKAWPLPVSHANWFACPASATAVAPCRVSKVRRDNAEFRDLLYDAAIAIVAAGNVLAGGRVLDVAQPIPD